MVAPAHTVLGNGSPEQGGHSLPPGPDMATGQGDDSETNPYPEAESSVRTPLA